MIWSWHRACYSQCTVMVQSCYSHGGTDVWCLQGHKNWVQIVSWSPDAAMLASGDQNGVIWLWQPKTGETIGACRGQFFCITKTMHKYPDFRTTGALHEHPDFRTTSTTRKHLISASPSQRPSVVKLCALLTVCKCLLRLQLHFLVETFMSLPCCDTQHGDKGTVPVWCVQCTGLSTGCILGKGHRRGTQTTSTNGHIAMHGTCTCSFVWFGLTITAARKPATQLMPNRRNTHMYTCLFMHWLQLRARLASCCEDKPK